MLQTHSDGNVSTAAAAANDDDDDDVVVWCIRVYQRAQVYWKQRLLPFQRGGNSSAFTQC